MSSNVARPSSDNSPAGLGVMGSMSETCTPLKHRYDACFNKWFGDYLGASGAPGSDPSSSTSSSSSSSSPSSSSRSTGGFFGSKSARSDAKTEGENAGAGAGADAGVREKLREKYEKECGALFREYRECVRVSLAPTVMRMMCVSCLAAVASWPRAPIDTPIPNTCLLFAARCTPRRTQSRKKAW